MEWAGFERTPGELEQEVLRLSFGWSDFGGVTFGGGEPTLQADELLDCLARLRRHGIHTAFESNASTPRFPAAARSASLAIADLKAGTPECFRKCTGGNLDAVLEHLTEAVRSAPDLLVRVPVITGMNDSESELEQIAVHLASLHRLRMSCAEQPLAVEILKLHHFGEPKYQALGRKYELTGRPPPDTRKLERFEHTLSSAGIALQRN